MAARSKKRKLVLPVIRELKRFNFLMTDKVQSICTLKIAYKK